MFANRKCVIMKNYIYYLPIMYPLIADSGNGIPVAKLNCTVIVHPYMYIKL